MTRLSQNTPNLCCWVVNTIERKRIKNKKFKKLLCAMQMFCLFYPICFCIVPLVLFMQMVINVLLILLTCISNLIFFSFLATKKSALFILAIAYFLGNKSYKTPTKLNLHRLCAITKTYAIQVRLLFSQAIFPLFNL